MGVLVGRDDRGRDLGALQQLVVVGGEEIGFGVLDQFLADLRIGVAQAEPADAGIVAGEFGPDAADRAAADDGEADRLSWWLHVGVLGIAGGLDPVDAIRPDGAGYTGVRNFL